MMMLQIFGVGVPNAMTIRYPELPNQDSKNQSDNDVVHAIANI